MKIQFRDKNIRKLCEDRKYATKQLGANCAKKLALRLAALEAAARVSELVAGNPHPLTGDRAGQMALNLAGGYRLVFAPKNGPLPLRPDGGTDWTQVNIISIEYIGDYHD